MRSRSKLCGLTLALILATQTNSALAAFVPMAFTNGRSQRIDALPGPLPTYSFIGFTGGASQPFNPPSVITSVVAFGPAALPAGEPATALIVSGLVSGGPGGSNLILTITGSSGPVELSQSNYDSGVRLASFRAPTPTSSGPASFFVALRDPALLAAINSGSGLRVRIEAERGVQATVGSLALGVTTGNTAAVPEPTSAVLVAVGGGVVGVVGWRRRRAVESGAGATRKG